MEETEHFFSDRNTVKSVSQEDLIQTKNYLDIAKAFSRITYKSIYIIDYQTKNFEFVSDNPLFLCGLTSEEVQELGYGFYFRVVKKEDLDLLLKINDVGFDFYEKLPVEDRKNYTISYDFHIINEKKHPILINHQLTPIFLNEEGKIWKAICIVALSANHTSGNIKISKQGSNSVWKFDIEHNKWIEDEKIKLSEREIEILRFYARGFTINEIADTIFLSIDTVKFHRRKLFEKIGVKNITEALAYAINNRLI
ncbi:response regulator transcription factor [Amniculibacterium sp. G2-70]|uniref:response regulator transcription factor n=1 Tax=Amniculibacterium sp. G2-70 TaxID=2767188 RepID=UPI00165447CB|nr:LuxR C-terminal-related transcriptional regulator [Amniculibacterium sp. G2-70]